MRLLQKITNPVGIQLIPRKWHDQLFKQKYRPYIDELTELSKSHLQQHLPTRTTNEIKIPDIIIPKLLGNSLSAHFDAIGANYMKDVNPLINQILNVAPKMPTSWSLQPGWTRYSENEQKSVPFPTEQVYIFDTEVLVPHSKYPILAVAMSPSHWYSWSAPWLFFDIDLDLLSLDDKLIPFGPNSNKLFVGHNIAYDRARILEEYTTSSTNSNFIDTLSMHISVCGLSNQQRPSYLMQKKFFNSPIDPNQDMSQWNEMQPDKWVQETSTNSLLEVAKFHCNITLDKQVRDVFVKGTLQDVKDQAQQLFQYCANDVDATHKVFKALYPKYIKKCPHPISQAGPLIMVKSKLPISNRWDEYVEINERKTQELINRIESNLFELAFAALNEILIKGPLLPKELTCDITPATPLKLEHYEYCSVDINKLLKYPHLCLLDWRIPKARFTLKGVPTKAQKLRNYPLWVHQLFTGKVMKLTFKMKHAVYLLNTKYDGQIVSFDPFLGYGILTNDPAVCSKYEQLQQTPYKPCHHAAYKSKTPLSFSSVFNDNEPVSIDEADSEIHSQFSNHTFIRLSPGDTMMGIFFTKSLSSQLKLLYTNSPDCLTDILTLASNAAYWVSARKRIDNQFIVPLPELPNHKGMILPIVIPSGTITRRSVEATWVTAANVSKGRFGSDLKMQVQAPTNYKIIGADVDSEELWIASLLADAQFQMHGSSAIGFMTLQGIKKDGTDMHSVTAKLVKISRDAAKGFNYARIYGSGEKHAANTLEIGQQLSKEESELKAKQLFEGTKGNKRDFRYVEQFKLPRRVWSGGTESLMFNILENAADLKEPCTPVLRAVIPDSLLPKNVDKEFATTRVNWIVQGSGVDYLHILMLLMDWFIKVNKIDCQFLISVHDEIRYLCHDKDVYKASLMLQISNLLTRAFFSERIGVYSLPLQCSFFSAVDVDTVLRKDPFTASETFPEIPNGTTMDMNELLDKIKCKDVFMDENSETEIENKEIKTYLEMVVPFTKINKELHLTWLKMQLATDKDEFYGYAKDLRSIMKNNSPLYRRMPMKRSKMANQGKIDSTNQ